MSILSPENTVSVIRGASKTLELTVKDEEGEVADLTGATIYFSVKKRALDEFYLIQKSSLDIAEIEIPNPTDGVAHIFLLPADTRGLDVRKYTYDIWVILGGERSVVIVPSVFEVLAGVTVIP